MCSWDLSQNVVILMVSKRRKQSDRSKYKYARKQASIVDRK